jgi:aminoglycoside phosphotransferase family enzyme
LYKYISNVIRDILILCDLPSITDLQAILPLEISWKKLVRKEVEQFWLKKLQNDATSKTTLKYLAIKHLEIGTSHSLWKMRSKTRIAV